MEEGKQMLRGGLAALTWLAEQAPSFYSTLFLRLAASYSMHGLLITEGFLSQP
jgi:hypothetical protein